MVDNVSVVIRSPLLTLRPPPHLLGRVSAANQIFIGSSNEIGSFESGVAAKLLGTVRSVVFGGIVTLGIVGVTARRISALRELDELTCGLAGSTKGGLVQTRNPVQNFSQ